jgi:hypothetical protein
MTLFDTRHLARDAKAVISIQEELLSANVGGAGDVLHNACTHIESSRRTAKSICLIWRSKRHGMSKRMRVLPTAMCTINRGKRLASQQALARWSGC